VALASLLPLLAACPGKPPVPPVVEISSRCPDLSKADEVAAFDFTKEYHLSREAADRLKAAALASLEMNVLADKLDADLGIACAQVANSLGDKGDWQSGSDACAAAVKAVQASRAKMGPKAPTLLARQPLCLVDAALMTRCASLCDSTVPSDRIKAECDRKAGRCDGNCDGTCAAKVPSKCEGTCSGTCEGSVKGTCGGRCRGTCDGRPANGPCAGTCAGTCDKGIVQGECKGTCAGTCRLARPGICESTCAGTCTVEWSDAKCAGELGSPEVNADCRARCQIAVINQTECDAPTVSLVVTASKDRDAGEQLKSAVEKSFPSLLKSLHEVGGDRGEKRVMVAQASIDATRAAFGELARTAGKQSAPDVEAVLGRCFAEPFQKAASLAAGVKAGLEQANALREQPTK